MDVKKAKKFNSRMGRTEGGLIKHVAGRKYFDTGGIATNTIAPTTGATGAIQGAGSTNNSGIANAIGLGNSFTAGSANIASGTNADQLGGAYTGANNAINAQVGLTNTLTPQASTAVGNQNALAAQELAMTQGAGPNPAQAQLAENTSTNVNNQAALMAGQRGAAVNPALIAREAAQQGAATQQGAVGQAATLQANQQIAAQSNLAGLSANQIGQSGEAVGNLNSTQQNEQNILQGANTAYNNSAVGMQSNENNVNAQTAAGNQAANKSLVGSIASVIPGLYKGGEVDDHLKMAEMNAHSLMHKQKFAQGGGVSFNPVVSAGGAGPGVEGTPAFGAAAQQQANTDFNNNMAKVGDKTKAAYANYQDNQALDDLNNEFTQEDAIMQSGAIDGAIDGAVMAYKGGMMHPGPHGSHVANYLAAGGASKKVPSMVSPGERYLNPDEVKEVVEKGANPLKLGKKILGKPKVKGDSIKNDTVPMDLDDGGVVIDRDTMGKKSPEKAELFVRRAVHMPHPNRKKA